jgi:hypothetical protein
MNALERDFLSLIAQFSLSDHPVDAKIWTDRIDKALQPAGPAILSAKFAPAVFAEFLVYKDAPPEVLIHLQRVMIHRLLNSEHGSLSQIEDLYIAMAVLAENASEPSVYAALQELLPQGQPILMCKNQDYSDNKLRLALRLIDALYAVGETATANELLLFMKPRLRRYPWMNQLYGKYLNPVPPQ